MVSVKIIGRKIVFWETILQLNTLQRHAPAWGISKTASVGVKLIFYENKPKFRPLQFRSTILLNATCPKILLNIWTWIALGLRPGTLFRPRSKLLTTAWWRDSGLDLINVESTWSPCFRTSTIITMGTFKSKTIFVSLTSKHNRTDREYFSINFFQKCSRIWFLVMWRRINFASAFHSSI